MAVLLDGQEGLWGFTRKNAHICNIFTTFIVKTAKFNRLERFLINLY